MSEKNIIARNNATVHGTDSTVLMDSVLISECGDTFDQDKLPCGVIQVSRDRKILYCNQYAADIVSQKSAHMIGRSIDDLTSAASKIFIDSYVYPLLLEDSKTEEIQINFKNTEGRSLPVVANIQMSEDSSTLWTLMVCENRDSLYEGLLIARDSLTQRALELQALNDKIQNDHEDLQVFCRSLSHDFTAPIQQIQALVTFALEDLQSKDLAIDGEVKMLEQSVQCADVLKSLIKGLIEYLTADARVQLDKAVNLDDVVSSAITLGEGEQPLNITIEPLPTVIGNSAQLLIVFKNLIGNAIKYTERDPEIAITCTKSTKTEYIIIAIKDNGIGMPAENLNKIFEPFSRLHGTSEYSGSVLGLSIVKKLVSNHNGNITVKSTHGEGSTFFVELPFDEAGNHP
jgi:signal transduction histidine kinase